MLEGREWGQETVLIGSRGLQGWEGQALTWIWLTLQVDVLIGFHCTVCFLRCRTMGLSGPVVPFSSRPH